MAIKIYHFEKTHSELFEAYCECLKKPGTLDEADLEVIKNCWKRKAISVIPSALREES